ncbi:hypothetical protein FWC63_02785 [Candidatus Saccharibacteria bacterium]|nr:hypothetical protein [Candidatus Saccharibacteria bacterium]
MENKRFQSRYDWGNGSYSSWSPGKAADQFDETLAGRLDAMPIGGRISVYHGSSYKIPQGGGEKVPCTEYLEIKRVA